MSLITVFRRFWQAQGKLPRQPALRRLSVESLEPLAMLSGLALASPATQLPTVRSLSSLPPAAQQTIAATIGQQARYDVPETAADAAGFGQAVALDGNTVVVGAPEANNGAGAAYVFVRTGSSWSDMTQVARLTPSDGGGSFGCAVAISGETIAVEAMWVTVGKRIDQDAVYAFTRPAAGWTNMTQTAELTASDGTACDDFGWSVAISGGTIVVGAAQAQVGSNTYQGAIYAFTRPAASAPPTITSTAATAASAGLKYTYQVKATAAAGMKLTYALLAAPAGMSIDAAIGLLTWLPSASQIGSNAVTIIATDPLGRVSQQSFSINVARGFIRVPTSPGPTDANHQPFSTGLANWWQELAR